MPLLPGIVQTLFELEDNPIRFERVCLDLYKDAEGVELVPTSRTWDLGRDGRSISISKNGTLLGILCATLSIDIDGKVEADILRLAETTNTRAIIYSTSRSLTEHACNVLEAKIRKLYPAVKSVRILGQIQLVALAERFENTIRKHYAAEIKISEQALLTVPNEPENIGLRLALITQTGDDARILRTELTRRLVLESLHSRGSQSAGSLAVAISGQLHLSRSMTTSYITIIISSLIEEGLVSSDKDGTICITPNGITFISGVPKEASAKLLEGRTAIRREIKRLSGHTLTEEQFERLWDYFQDGLSEVFYSHGAAIVRMVGSLITGERGKPEPKTYLLLEEVGNHIGSLFSDPIQGDEVRQAIIDMFSEKESEAFNWLTQICSVYVMMCSLGFEALSSEQITRVLRNFRLVPDTDIIISLLCEGENNHKEVSHIVNGWRLLGGKILMSTPVLEETAFHAWISEHDYVQMWEQLDQISDSEAYHLIENAFVRSFRILSRENTSRRYWNQYINQYRGESERDYSRVMLILREDYGFDRLPDAEENYQNFPNKVRIFLAQKLAENIGISFEDLSFKMHDKSRRDGSLFGSVLRARDASRRSAIQSTTIILSSSRLLKQADQAFRSELGEPDAVVSTAAVGCLLTLTPGVLMGMGTLREVLFDLGLATRLTPMQRYAYRLITASGEFDLPWSRRVTLQRELGERLLSDARATGDPVPKVIERVMKSEDPEFSVKMIVKALDNMAVTPKTEKELQRLRKEVKILEEKLKAR